MSWIDYHPLTGERRRVVAILLALGVTMTALAAWYGVDRLSSGRTSPASLGNSYYTVLPVSFDIVIRKDGELQAVRNTDILCEVQGQNTVRTIVPEGSYVRKGDPLFELDTSELQRKIQTAQLDVQRSESELTAAREQLAIQASKNEADLEAANVELKLARLDLEEYIDGKYPQQLSEAERGKQMAEFNLKSKEQSLAQTKSLFNKGFVTQSEVEKAQLEFVTAQNEFEKKSTELKVLRDYTHQKELADKQNKVAQSEKKVARVESENLSTLSQKTSEAQSKERMLMIHRAALEHLEKQLGSCSVIAPVDGIVVYGSTVHYYGEMPIQPGAKVMEQQLLVRLPETGTMKAVVRLSEHEVAKVRSDEKNPMRATVKLVGRDRAIPATLHSVNLLSDSRQRWWNPELKEFPANLHLEQTPENLKPGASCVVEIMVDRVRNVLAVPIGAIYTHKDQHIVWVKQGAELVQTPVRIGRSNELMIEITEGLQAGQRVVMLKAGQGRELLGIVEDELPPTSEPTDPEPEIASTVTASPR